MKNKLILLLAAFFLCSAFTADKPVITIFMIGDSTMANKSLAGGNPERGWGHVLPGFFSEDIRVDNHAMNGRSSKSFIDEGRWDKVLSQMKKGDYVFIQFGHNDEKSQDPARYTEPFSTYMENLETFIRVARDHSAYPVLITPLERRCFMDEKHLGIGAHSDYVAAMKQTAEKNNVPLVDLYSMSRMELKKAGEKNSRRWYMFFPEGEYKNHPEKSEDNTHLRYDGAVNFASLIAKGLREIGGIYAELLLDDLKL